jgi:hypothetical protein
MQTNQDRDFPSIEAELQIKKLALACAEAYNGPDASLLARCETALVVSCLSHGLLNLDEYMSIDRIEYDGIDDEEGNARHHVYVYLDAEPKNAALDITCDHVQ